MTFDDYTIKKGIDLSGCSESFIKFVRTAFNKYHVSLAPILTSSRSESEMTDLVNDSLRRSYKIQFHNVGKKASTKYYDYESHFCWLKLEHFLITHFYRIEKSVSNVSNKYIAIKLGWLSKNEKDPEVITKALRKVTDNLAILKNDRKTISVEQKFVHGRKGSYHLIKANWLVIIDLYTHYNPNMNGSIRLRKSIRYRIISLIKNTSNSFSSALANLMQSQKYSYLKNLIKFDLNNFADTMFIIKRILAKHKEIIIPSDLSAKHMICNYDHPNLVMTIKDKLLYDELCIAEENLSNEFKDKYGITLLLESSL
ncbi:MAG: hypothetical protein JEZ05_06315 [Tenericutes bacterium]|nr:hypothetical protein [Mycoplasmatota bacterium]